MDEIDGDIVFGQIYEWVFEGDNSDHMHRFIETMKRRGAEVKEWMEERLQEVVEEKLEAV